MAYWLTVKGKVNALTGIFFKAGFALGGVIPGFVLAMTGFNAKAATQTALAQQGILWLMVVIPAILLVFAMFIISNYEIDDQRIAEIDREIEERQMSES